MALDRVMVLGATGNVGTSVVRRLTADPEVGSVVGVARRIPDWTLPKVTWTAADIRTDDVTRARTELGWTPRHTARHAIEEFLTGLRRGEGLPTAPLESRVDGGRLHELGTGVGEQP
jgi:nucleoside-diphosphate-sugar epimerase